MHLLQLLRLPDGIWPRRPEAQPSPSTHQNTRQQRVLNTSTGVGGWYDLVQCAAPTAVVVGGGSHSRKRSPVGAM